MNTGNTFGKGKVPISAWFYDICVERVMLRFQYGFMTPMWKGKVLISAWFYDT